MFSICYFYLQLKLLIGLSIQLFLQNQHTSTNTITDSFTIHTTTEWE